MIMAIQSACDLTKCKKKNTNSNIAKQSSGSKYVISHGCLDAHDDSEMPPAFAAI